MSDVWGLSGRTALVTGSSSGIGAALVQGFLQAGATVLGVSRTQSSVDHADFHAINADLSNRESTLALLERLSAEFPVIDVVVNNAGAATRAPATDFSAQEWDKLIELNLTAPFLISREVARGMIERRAGKILFIASLWSFQGGNQVSAYTATKSGVAGLVRALSNEWAPLGLQVNGIAPGYVETPLTHDLLRDPTKGPELLRRVPVGRFGEPSDVVGGALFLSSPHSDYLTGVVLPVDGGWLAA